jgi:hypothetical protein
LSSVRVRAFAHVSAYVTADANANDFEAEGASAA